LANRIRPNIGMLAHHFVRSSAAGSSAYVSGLPWAALGNSRLEAAAVEGSIGDGDWLDRYALAPEQRI